MNEKARPSCRFQLLKNMKAEKPKHPQWALSSVKRMNCEQDEDDSETTSLEPNP